MTADESRWVPAYVGVGSNLEDPRAQVMRAMDALGRLPSTLVIARSPLYETPPFGEVTQPPFVNAAAGLLTQLSAEDMLAALRALEKVLGREPPRERWGPRVIDLDLLVLGREQRATDILKLPHPGIAARDFVLYPLADIAPDLEVPAVGVVRKLRDRVDNRGVRKL
ncbi:MAG TPA: 2-amino-4-hydroxy-6-hydroxymethyldihydropteridine diphosphokinase [Steroidobacteraceae bacterium]|nr:2-amino-4-hydroxy-6-hydroxymethyldihydropteridine diphosphokinase [Steroidobacteraceae bacterium]